ncbi:hypothetical protein LV164_007006 [Aspergillus fumigatus]|nr:hypothetical protein LV164_007006 [Aspergillus fumigatus]
MNVIAEKELQPSTSPRVCEVWNGRNVERRLTLWSSTNPPIKEHIVHGNEVHENKNGPFEHCRENNEKYKYKRNHGFQSEKGGNNLTDDMQYPPNLSLNLGPYSRCEKSCGVLITGLALQLSVLTFAALTTFFPLWTGEFSHDNLRSRLVFFSFTCAGTLLLSLSLWWTAYTIGKPEISRVYKPKEDSQQTFVVWAQRENDDLGTEACIIIKKIEKELISAHRNLELPELGYSIFQPHKIPFTPREDMHIRPNPPRLVQRPHPHKPTIRPRSTVVRPNRYMALRTASDVLSFAGFRWREDHFWFNYLVLGGRYEWRAGWLCGPLRRRRDDWRGRGEESDPARLDDGV